MFVLEPLLLQLKRLRNLRRRLRGGQEEELQTAVENNFLDLSVYHFCCLIIIILVSLVAIV